jgi:hypothetical protein
MLLYRQRPAAAAAAGAVGATAVGATAAGAMGGATTPATAAAAMATAALGSPAASLDLDGGASLAADAQADAAMVDEVPGVATAGAAPRGDSLIHELKRHCAGQAAVGGGGGGGGGASAATVPSAPLLSEAEVRAAAEGGGDACDMETEETEDNANPYARGF